MYIWSQCLMYHYHDALKMSINIDIAILVKRISVVNNPVDH